MLRFNVTVSLYKKNEETGKKDPIIAENGSEFEYNVREEIYRTLDGVFLIGENGEVYTFIINEVERDND